MKRSSLIGPVLLILIGGLFLANNLHADFPLMKVAGDYWPFVLIAWGFVRLAEILYWAATDKPLPMNGVSGGEWGLVIFVCVIGSGFSAGSRIASDWPAARFTLRSLDVLGESFDFPLAEQKVAAGKTPRVVVENLRGNVRIVGADIEEVKSGGRSTIRAFQKTEADRVNQLCPLEVVRQGDLFIVRTNQEKATGSTRISTDLEVTVPRGASVEGRGRTGDFDVTDVSGNLDLTSENAGVRMSNLGGNVHLDLRHSDIVRAVNVKGSLEMKGNGGDVELDNVEGTATVLGSYSGELSFRRIGKALHYQTSSTDLRVLKVPGQIRMGRGDLNGNNITGPILLKTGSKDVELNDFTDAVDITVDRGDIDLRPGHILTAGVDARTRSGNISLAVPSNSRFQISATADRGEVVNELGLPLEVRNENHGAKLAGSIGMGGPQVILNVSRGQVTVRKAAIVSPEATQMKQSQEPVHLEVEKQ